MVAGVLYIIFWLGIIAVYIALMVLLYRAADKTGRSTGGWTFFALFTTPLFCLILIYLLGETDEKRRERIKEEEELRMRIKEKSAEKEKDSALTKIVGKKPVFTNKLKTKLNYESGIHSFDTYLGDNLSARAVIYFTEYPNGFVITVETPQSSCEYGLSYNAIQKIQIFNGVMDISKLIFEMVNDKKIVFTVRTKYISEVLDILDKLNLKYTFR